MTTPTSWSSGTLVLQGSSSTINNWSGGEVYLINANFTDNTLLAGQDSLVAVGTDNVSINTSGLIPANATLSIWNAGTLGGTLSTGGDTIQVAGFGKLTAHVNLISGNGGPFGGYGGKVIFDEPDQGPTILIGQQSGMIDYAQMAFLQNSTGVTLNDGFGQEGMYLPGMGPDQATNGQLPTIEIDNLSALKMIGMTEASLTLDFTNGTSATFSNFHVNDTKYFSAEQTPNGTLYLSEHALPNVAGASRILVLGQGEAVPPPTHHHG